MPIATVLHALTSSTTARLSVAAATVGAAMWMAVRVRRATASARRATRAAGAAAPVAPPPRRDGASHPPEVDPGPTRTAPEAPPASAAPPAASDAPPPARAAAPATADDAALRALLEQRVVERIRADAVAVPPYPAVAQRIRQLVARHDYGLDQVARLVSADPALAADTLRCANSALYARGGAVTAVPAAVARVGSQEVLRLALASALGSLARARGPLLPLRRRAWIDALGAAAVSEELARLRGLSPDDGFLCGLLHDFGKVVAAAALESVVEAGTPARPLAFWEGMAERFHGELGLVSAARWDLPPVLADVISSHHAATFEGTAAPELVQVVADADRAMAALRRRPRVGQIDVWEAGGRDLAQARAVERLLERLPSFIASFEVTPGDAGSATSLVACDRPLLPEVEEPFGATIRGAGLECAANVVAVGTRALVVSGDRALPVEGIVEVVVACPPDPLAVWCCVASTWRDGAGGHGAALEPLALSASSAARWDELGRR